MRMSNDYEQHWLYAKRSQNASLDEVYTRPISSSSSRWFQPIMILTKKRNVYNMARCWSGRRYPKHLLLLVTWESRMLLTAMLTGWGQTSIQRTKLSIKRPIDCLLSRERLLLKEFNDEAVTDWSSRLFHTLTLTLTTLSEKKYNLMSRRQRFFSSLRERPLVRRLLSS